MSPDKIQKSTQKSETGVEPGKIVHGLSPKAQIACTSESLPCDFPLLRGVAKGLFCNCVEGMFSAQVYSIQPCSIDEAYMDERARRELVCKLDAQHQMP